MEIMHPVYNYTLGGALSISIRGDKHATCVSIRRDEVSGSSIPGLFSPDFQMKNNITTQFPPSINSTWLYTLNSRLSSSVVASHGQSLSCLALRPPVSPSTAMQWLKSEEAILLLTRRAHIDANWKDVARYYNVRVPHDRQRTHWSLAWKCRHLKNRAEIVRSGDSAM